MPNRLLVGVLGNPNSGKSHTWNTLFEQTVHTGSNPRHLKLRPNECVEVFLVSGSFEERGKYAGDVLKNQDSRIVLCSMQYTEEVSETLDYFVGNDFYLYIQWLNPGYSDGGQSFDSLGLVNQILSAPSLLSIRDGKINANSRVREIKDFIYGWAASRKLIKDC